MHNQKTPLSFAHCATKDDFVDELTRLIPLLKKEGFFRLADKYETYLETLDQETLPFDAQKTRTDLEQISLKR